MRRPGVGRYLLVAVAFAVALMSKPMVVTLPVVLLLLDAWPLRRTALASSPGRSCARLVAEKAPLVAMSLVVSVVTVAAQAETSLVTVAKLPLADRITNALVSWAAYLGKAVWPVDLAVLYPHRAWQPGGIPAWQVATSAILLAGISALAAWQWRRRPYVAVGWLWYLVTLVPVIGLVQVGTQSMADRYAYLPLIGATFAVAWSIPASAWASRVLRLGVGVLVAAVVAISAVAARAQVRLWRDTRTLFEHTTSVTSHNELAWEILGNAYMRLNRLDLALQAYQQAMAARAVDPNHWRNLAEAQSRAGNLAAAARTLEHAVEVAPGDLEAWYALGVAYARLGQPARVEELVERLRRLDPAMADELVRRFTGAGPRR